MAKYQEILEVLNKLSEGFGRIDERTRNIWRSAEAQEQHLKELNGSTRSVANRVSVLETKLEERTTSKISRKRMAGISVTTLAIATVIYYIGQAFGWWQGV